MTTIQRDLEEAVKMGVDKVKSCVFSTKHQIYHDHNSREK